MGIKVVVWKTTRVILSSVRGRAPHSSLQKPKVKSPRLWNSGTMRIQGILKKFSRVKGFYLNRRKQQKGEGCVQRVPPLPTHATIPRFYSPLLCTRKKHKIHPKTSWGTKAGLKGTTWATEGLGIQTELLSSALHTCTCNKCKHSPKYHQIIKYSIFYSPWEF